MEQILAICSGLNEFNGFWTCKSDQWASVVKLKRKKKRKNVCIRIIQIILKVYAHNDGQS